jgi:hypothetical protein
MKKIMILFAITVMAVNVNAQWFLGGEVGINANVAEPPKNQDAGKEYLVGFIVAPKMGYYFNEKLALGLEASFGVSFVNRTEYYQYPDGYYGAYLNDATLINWRIAPFLRHSVFTHKKFTLILEGNIGVGGTHINNYSSSQRTSSVISVGVLNIAPVLCYKFTEKFQLEAALNFLNIGYNIDVITSGEGTEKQTALLHDLNIGFNTKSIFVMSQLSIGVIYKFN